MSKLSPLSLSRLVDVDIRLIDVIQITHKALPVVVIEGHRGQEAQTKAFSEGKSKLPWPQGKHNKKPSFAVDIAPDSIPGAEEKINWDVDPKTLSGRANRARFYYLAGYMLATADSLGTKLRWGGDWDRDTFFDDQTFDDLVHFEIVE